MQLELAKPEHSQQLSDFYKEFTRKGNVELKVNRHGKFFSPYEIQSDQHLTYILKENDQIEGLASFVIRDVLLDNKVKTVAFGRDLRISSNRRAVVEWTKHFLPVMQEIQQAFGCQYFFSVMSGNDVQASNAFIRPRTMKRPLPHYHMFRRFNLTTLHGQMPWAKNPLPHLRIRHGSPQMEDALIYYVLQKSKEKDLATTWDFDSFADKMSRWKNFEISDFLIAVDKDENIVGCVAPWSAGGIQDYVPLEYGLRGHNFRQFLKFGELFGWTRSITKPVTRLKTEEPLRFNYLNFLHADNEDIFEALLWAAYERSSKKEFLVYSQTRTEFMYRKPIDWIGARIPYSVFLLLQPDQKIPDFMRPTNERAIEIEPFFV